MCDCKCCWWDPSAPAIPAWRTEQEWTFSSPCGVMHGTRPVMYSGPIERWAFYPRILTPEEITEEMQAMKSLDGDEWVQFVTERGGIGA